MKKLLCLLLPMLLLMSGCKYHDYHLTKEDGHYYIQYDVAPNANRPVLPHYPAPNYPFRSVKEMKDTIINGSFTQEQHDYLIEAMSNSNGSVYVFDIDNLYEATYPSDLDMTLYFHGSSYSWRTNTDDDDSLGVSLSLTSEEIFASNRDLEDSLRSYNEVTSVTSTEDRDATIIDYIRFDGDVIKAIIYTIETDEKTLVIVEEHYIEYENKSQNPYQVAIYGHQADEYFYVRLYNLTERPSVEWLSQFGIKEYVEP